MVGKEQSKRAKPDRGLFLGHSLYSPLPCRVT